MSQVQVEQKTYQNAAVSPSHTFSPVATSSDRFDFTKRSSEVAF